MTKAIHYLELSGENWKKQMKNKTQTQKTRKTGAHYYNWQPNGRESTEVCLELNKFGKKQYAR